MAPKIHPKSAAFALSVAALAGLALVPTASAASSTSTGIFGIKSVDAENSSITSYAGMSDTKTNPGDGGTTTPGGGSTTDPGNGETVPDCTPLVADPTGYKRTVSYDNYDNYFTPQANGSSSDWMDQVAAAGGTIKVGKPTVSSSSIYVGYTDNSYGSVPKTELPQYSDLVGDTLHAAAKNTGVPHAEWSTDEDREAFKHTSLKQYSSEQLNVDTAMNTMNSAAVIDYLSEKTGKRVSYAGAYDWTITYPVSVVWKATGERASCESQSTPVVLTEYAPQ